MKKLLLSSIFMLLTITLSLSAINTMTQTKNVYIETKDKAPCGGKCAEGKCGSDKCAAGKCNSGK